MSTFMLHPRLMSVQLALRHCHPAAMSPADEVVCSRCRRTHQCCCSTHERCSCRPTAAQASPAKCLWSSPLWRCPPACSAEPSDCAMTRAHRPAFGWCNTSQTTVHTSCTTPQGTASANGHRNHASAPPVPPAFAPQVPPAFRPQPPSQMHPTQPQPPSQVLPLPPPWPLPMPPPLIVRPPLRHGTCQPQAVPPPQTHGRSWAHLRAQPATSPPPHPALAQQS